MALSSKLFTEKSLGRGALKRCSEVVGGHLLRGRATTPGDQRCGYPSALSIQKNFKLLRGFLQMNVAAKQFIVNLNETLLKQELLSYGCPPSS